MVGYRILPITGRSRNRRAGSRCDAGSPPACRPGSGRTPAAPERRARGQTERIGPGDDAAHVAASVAGRLEALDRDGAATDVRPFLERLDDAALVTKDNALRLLARPGSPSR